ncbi:MAG: Nif3-like dinuclear metal center hexameric protein [Bacteroidota bacterium]
MQIKDIINFLEEWAPSGLQESYDNSGLIIGDRAASCQSALVTLDVTEEVVDEAIRQGYQLIIAHHPMIFSGIKRIGTKHWLDKCIRKAIKNDLHIYAIHTNLDHVVTGVNQKIAEKIGLINTSILSPKSHTLLKLTVFVPTKDKQHVLNSLYESGAGKIGKYSHCSFQLTGEGTFRPNEQANPTIGAIGQDEKVEETRIEVILPVSKKNSVLSSMVKAHPYEEVAYYLSSLENINQEIGAGMIGELPEELPTHAFLMQLKDRMNLNTIRCTKLVRDKVKHIALCGGSGSFLLKKAISKKADVFITADFKYHDFFEANDQLIVADIGHYESEVFTKVLIQEKLTEKFPNFAVRLSDVDTNPITYL